MKKNPLSQTIKKIATPERFRHSMAVSDLAARLGALYKISPEKLKRAALAHDAAKHWSGRRLKKYAIKHRLRVPARDFVFAHSPGMLHGFVAAHLAKKKGWVKDASSLRAIRFHTLGSMRMGLEEKILYIADFCAKDRAFPEARFIRKLAEKDLDAAFKRVLMEKILFTLRKGRPIHPAAIRLWNKLSAA